MVRADTKTTNKITNFSYWLLRNTENVYYTIVEAKLKRRP